MLIISPYDTTYGKKINISNVNKEVVRYITTTSNKNLNYEYVVNDTVGLVIITGCDDDERSLPIMEHPVIVKDIRNKEIVIVDIRKYVKPITEQPLYIKDIVKDQASVMFIINRGITTIDFIAGDFGNYRNVFKNIIAGYAMLVSNTVNSMVALSPTEKLDVELTAALFANMLLTNDDTIEDTLDATEARLGTCKLSLPVSKKYINSKIITLDTKDKTIDGLVNNIKRVLGNSKSDIINTNVLVNMLANVWYGPGNSETVIMSLEHMPTFIPLLYINITDKTYKRTRLASILDKYSRNIGNIEFEKSMSLYYNEKVLA